MLRNLLLYSCVSFAYSQSLFQPVFLYSPLCRTLAGEISNIRQPASITILLLSVALIPVFILWEGRRERLRQPALIPNSLWRSATFTSVCLTVLFSNAVAAAMEVYCSLLYGNSLILIPVSTPQPNLIVTLLQLPRNPTHIRFRSVLAHLALSHSWLYCSTHCWSHHTPYKPISSCSCLSSSQCWCPSHYGTNISTLAILVCSIPGAAPRTTVVRHFVHYWSTDRLGGVSSSHSRVSGCCIQYSVTVWN